MAAPSSGLPINQDTLVTVKVCQDNLVTRRFKLPLRDLGARAFPLKIRQLLGIPPDQPLTLERYSDSAGSYVLLDSENPAVYKQLYRAAKAKLKLRIRATTPSANPPAAHPEPQPQESTSQPDTSSMSETATVAASSTVQDSNDASPKGNAFVLPARPNALTTIRGKKSYPLLFQSPNAVFCIDCNHCGDAIPGEHYHCGICDDGDFDLCPKCVNAGVTCRGEGHWLLKRLIKDGVVVNSTTETIAPRRSLALNKASEPAPTEKPASDEKPPAPASDDAVKHMCNACLKRFNEEDLFVCQVCEKQSVCITCILKDTHGHHPGHGFEMRKDRDFVFKNLLLSRSRPGRHYSHAAICDGCDKRIYGVRYKCLSCPDWDFCSACHETATQTHPTHRFVPIYESIGDPVFSKEVHTGIYCDGPLCVSKQRSPIVGVRYKCAICDDLDFCANCEALPTNPHNRSHPLIKFQTPVRDVTINTFAENEFGMSLKMGDRRSAAVQVGSEPATTATQTEDVAPTDQAESTTAVASTVSEKTTEKAMSPEPQPEPQALFVRDTVADGTEMGPGVVFEQTWTLHNPGPVPWPAGCMVRFVGGEPMFNVDTKHPFDIDTVNAAMSSNELQAPVPVGESADFTVTLKSPSRPGTSISYWRLKLPDGKPFGHKLWCDIRVTEKTSPVEETKEVAPQPSESNMIFPKLEKSTASSAQEAAVAPAAAPSVTGTDKTEDDSGVLEDMESLTLEEVTDGEEFLTDEEYDILDASDQELSRE